MKSSPNETISEEIKPILQLKRPLLPIEKYAAREGISKNIVEEYVRLGIIQIRKYKDKAYVVDVPLSPYNPVSEELKTLQESYKIASSISNKYKQPVDTINRVKKTSESKPSRPSTSISPPRGLRDSSVELRQAQKTTPNINKTTSKPTKQNIDTLKTETRSALTNIDTKQAGSQRTRQAATVSLIVCLFAALLTFLWLYVNQKVHRGRLDQTYARIQNVYDDFVRTSQQLAALQGKLVESTAEIEWIKNELNNAKTESENMRNDLDQVKRNLDTIQQYNTAALGQLREKLQHITNQLDKVLNNSTSLFDSSALKE